MNICEFIQEKIAIGEFDDNVLAHLRICHECKAFANDLDRFLSCDLPDAGEPPKHVDDAIRAAGRRAAAANVRRKRMAGGFRILIPAAAALAVCFLFFFNPMSKPEPLTLPTQATVVGDWTGAVMDGELTQVTMEVSNSMMNLELSDNDLLLAQLEADFAAYAEN